MEARWFTHAQKATDQEVLYPKKWPPTSQAKSEKLPSVSYAGLTKELIQVVTGVVYVLSEWL